MNTGDILPDTRNKIGVGCARCILTILLLHSFLFGEFIVEDFLIASEVSDFDVIFDRDSILHYVHSTRQFAEVHYIKFDTLLNVTTPADVIVDTPTQIIMPHLVLGDSKLLLTYGYVNPGNWSTIDGKFVDIATGSVSEYFIIGPVAGFMINSGQAAIHLEEDDFLVSWVVSEGTSGPPWEGVRLRKVSEEMSDFSLPLINDSLAEITSQSWLSHSPISDSSIVTWSEDGMTLFGQLVNSEGAYAGDSFELASNTSNVELYYSKTICFDSGNFITFWVEQSGNVWHLYSRKFDLLGDPISSITRVDPEGSVFWHFDVTQDNQGNMILLLAGRFGTSFRTDIYAQKMDNNAELLGDLYKITSSPPDNSRWNPKVILFNDRVYTFWKENLELWGNVTSYSNPPTSINQTIQALPESIQLYSVYPNPFNATITIQYELQQASQFNLTVYDAVGRNVWSYEESQMEAGSHSIQWRGENNQGKQMQSGIYFISLSIPEFSAVQKAVLIR